MDVVWTIIIGLLLLTLFVVVHEWGHYIAAKKAGITVLEFSIGFGPLVYKRMMKDDTQFSIRCLPIGGYCKFFGDEEGDEKKPGAFNHATIPQRLLTFVAGPAMNFLLAFILAVAFLCFYGDALPTVSSVEPGSPAATVGLQKGDIIHMFNGMKIDFGLDFEDAKTNPQPDGNCKMMVERDGKMYSLNVPYKTGTSKIGITADPKDYVSHKFGFFEAIALGFKWLVILVKEMIAILGTLIFTGQGVQNLAGPVGTVNIIGQVAKMGLDPFLRLASLISINLAVINLFPFPALDGGQILFLGVEAARKKPVPLRVAGILNTIGLMIIFGFAIYLTFQDIGRLTGS